MNSTGNKFLIFYMTMKWVDKRKAVRIEPLLYGKFEYLVIDIQHSAKNGVPYIFADFNMYLK